MKTATLYLLTLGAFMPLIALFLARLSRVSYKSRLPDVAFFMGATFFVAPLTEVILNAGYKAFTGHFLWQYHTLPIGEGSTSWVAVVIWPSYALYTYLLHHILKRYVSGGRFLLVEGAMSGVKALVLEAAFNGVFLALYGIYVAYYLPGDLWHLTSVQVYPFYVLAGFAQWAVLTYVRVEHWRWVCLMWAAACASLATIAVVA